ncbi:hypothetical protein N7457_007376 [Penicillium paradoxum]|uniref:uncharacterized protein n=1 Tax=Penicillium paradoxum TaxID=176176 RepID=UPI002547290B|nr:uncharacterized protein N7457_007376 [Penicillium paradoxum]KAJ5779656.1 hypothetical protein N7457_007376 [Penicillium paradoxum]
MSSEVSPSGISTNPQTGERFIPSSVRADGSVRKELRVRPGYKPDEDIERYKPPGARSTGREPETQGESLPAKEIHGHNSQSGAETNTVINETLTDSEVPGQPLKTSQTEMAPADTNMDACKDKVGALSVRGDSAKSPRAARRSKKAKKKAKANGDPSAVTNKDAMHRDLPLRLKKPAKTGTTAEYKAVEPSRSITPPLNNERPETEAGFTAQSTMTHEADQPATEDLVDEGQEYKPRSLPEKKRGREDMSEKIPTLSEMRKMVQNMPTMTTLGFNLPRSHKSRKADTCHASYYKLRRSRRKVTWKVTPASEPEQWFDAQTTPEG